MGAPLDLSVEVTTPEHVAFRYRLAGPFQRLTAYFLDVLFRTGFFVGFIFVMGWLGWLNRGIWLASLLVLWFLLEWFYGAMFEAYMNGQTLGKRLMGLRVMSVNGCAIDGAQAVLRNLLRAADLLPWVSLAPSADYGALFLPVGAVGLLTMLVTRRFQRLGDIVAGTMVVHEERVELPTLPWAGHEEIQRCLGMLPADFVPSHTMLRAVAAYVARRHRLDPRRQRELSMRLAGPLLRYWNLPATTNGDALLCAVYLRGIGGLPKPRTGRNLQRMTPPELPTLHRTG